MRAGKIPSEKYALMLAPGMDVPLYSLRKEFLADKIAGWLAYEENPRDILLAAESRIAYFSTRQSMEILIDDIKRRLLELDDLQKRWKSQKLLNALQLEKLLEHFNLNYTFDSNRIEGNIFRLHETHLIVNEGMTISGKSL
ncbi:MAG: hypothetical protein ACI9K1_000453 [Arcticibacterium sp.]|jgi:hypothetical protein